MGIVKNIGKHLWICLKFDMSSPHINLDFLVKLIACWFKTSHKQCQYICLKRTNHHTNTTNQIKLRRSVLTKSFYRRAQMVHLKFYINRAHWPYSGFILLYNITLSFCYAPFSSSSSSEENPLSLATVQVSPCR